MNKIKDNLLNRRGNFPCLERKPKLKALADAANLESEVPAIKAAAEIKAARDRFRHLRAALMAAPSDDPALFARLDAAHRDIEALGTLLSGDPVIAERNEPPAPSIKSLADRVGEFHLHSTSEPTETQQAAAARATEEFGPLRAALDEALVEIADLTRAVDDAGGTWTPR